MEFLLLLLGALFFGGSATKDALDGADPHMSGFHVDKDRGIDRDLNEYWKDDYWENDYWEDGPDGAWN